MTATSPRREWTNAKRIVVKIGSALLVDSASGRLRSTWLNSLADDVAGLIADGKDVVLVSSGAIALGRHVLGLPRRALELEESQAAAAVGQISLAAAYRDVFSARGHTVAQVLLTLGDTEERRRYLNARRTIDTLLARKAVPVVNENDTVATTEIRYGDNDRLSARVASMITADVLVLLSDIDGLYTAPPGTDKSARRIDEVRAITAEIEAMAGGAASAFSRGGMKTKIEAGKIALASGTHMVIASGQRINPLRQLVENAPSTWFLAQSDPVAARKRWIAGQLDALGVIYLDQGAEKALASGKSLLPAGVTRVEGHFERGDAVVLRGTSGTELGRGLVAYSSEDALRIIGKKSSEIAEILGPDFRTEIVHRDDMALSRS
ncbi:MAG TPA: glutamate 5-kinase [Hyphomicrobiaceae bacterium]|nr:glutamate 5-kinase [Hyphomicrobiaceae bacterium]